MKKSDMLAMLKLVPEASRTEEMQDAISKLSATRGMSFDVETDVEGLEDGKWYTLDEKGQAVSVPSEKVRADGRTAQFVPYYRTI